MSLEIECCELKYGDMIKVGNENKDGITSFYVGANWGMVKKKKMFGGVENIKVDLDLSALLFDNEGRNTGIVYHGNRVDRGIIHTGDDVGGDADGDDGLDNEAIEVKTSELVENTAQIVFVLNVLNTDNKKDEAHSSYTFSEIPFASIRLFEGRPSEATRIIATYNIAKNVKFKGATAMVLGKLIKADDEWLFRAIGDPTSDEDFTETIATVKKGYLAEGEE